MEHLKTLLTPTGRAAVTALAISMLAILRIFGLGVPEVSDDVVSKLIDAVGLFVLMLAGGSALHKAAPPAAGLLLLFAIPLVTGCASFGHWSNPTLEELTNDFCGRQAKAHEQELAKMANARGLSLTEILAAFQTACLLRAKQSAERAGMAGARRFAAKGP